MLCQFVQSIFVLFFVCMSITDSVYICANLFMQIHTYTTCMYVYTSVTFQGVWQQLPSWHHQLKPPAAVHIAPPADWPHVCSDTSPTAGSPPICLQPCSKDVYVDGSSAITRACYHTCMIITWDASLGLDGVVVDPFPSRGSAEVHLESAN